MKVQAGDVVHVRAKVLAIGCSDRFGFGSVHVEDSTGDYQVRPDDIVHVEPRALQVGDKVICPSMSRATVAAIGEGFTWVKYEDGSGYSTCDTSALDRI